MRCITHAVRKGFRIPNAGSSYAKSAAPGTKTENERATVAIASKITPKNGETSAEMLAIIRMCAAVALTLAQVKSIRT